MPGFVVGQLEFALEISQSYVDIASPNPGVRNFWKVSI
jgi:hypothetical protein